MEVDGKAFRTFGLWRTEDGRMWFGRVRHHGDLRRVIPGRVGGMQWGGVWHLCVSRLSGQIKSMLQRRNTNVAMLQLPYNKVFLSQYMLHLLLCAATLWSNQWVVLSVMPCEPGSREQGPRRTFEIGGGTVSDSILGHRGGGHKTLFLTNSL